VAPQGERRLIVNADDLGITEGVNEAIIAAHERGSVSSATLMVNQAATEHAAALAGQHPGLGVGLHFNLTLGRPVAESAVPSLTDGQGQLLSRKAFERRALTGRIRGRDVARELAAQAEAFRRLGLPMSHVDSHQHVHALPVVLRAVAGYCRGHGLPMRVPWVSGAAPGRSLRRRVREQGLQALLHYGLRRWGRDVQTNRGFTSVFDLAAEADAVGEDTYRRLLARVRGDPVELMVHPARVDDRLQALIQIASFGAAEGHLLQQLSLGALAGELGYRLISYRDLTPA